MKEEIIEVFNELPIKGIIISASLFNIAVMILALITL